jgi:hypothetical protein
MAGKGGYQRPSNPAMVSGPGAHSQRTDGQPTEDNPTQAARYISGLPYGEAGQANALAQAAPLAAAQGIPAAPIVPLDAPSQRPDEHVTTAPDPNAISPLDTTDTTPAVDMTAAAIRAAYMSFPSPQLAAMVARLDQEGR